MQLDFKALEQALAPIAEIGQGELTFDVGGTPVTVRVLRPSEEVEAQKYAAPALETEGSQAAVEYMDRFRLACLSYAIVAVGNQDFRNVDYVTTGEKLDNGTEVKVQKHKALRDLLARWTRAALAGVFNKFYELVLKTEKEAEKAIVFEPADIPSEIDRLQQRITELRGQMEKNKALERTKFSETVEMVQAQTQATSEVEAPPPPEPEEVSEPSPALGPVRRAPITPQRAAPPPVVQVPPPAPVSPSATQQMAAPPAPPAPQAPPPRPDSSFVNFDDDDGVHAAMEAETQRLLEMRRRAARNQQPQDEGGALDQVRHRRPPHLDALEAEEEIGVTQAAAMRAREVGVTPDGTPVFALPAQDLDTPSFRGRPSAGPLNPQVRQGGATNPRFQRPNKP